MSVIRSIGRSAWLASFLFVLACDPKVMPCDDPATCFKPTRFKEELRNRLEGKSIGYGFAINYMQDLHQFSAGGYERLPQDPPERAFSVFDGMNPASMSKTVTAAALIHALRAKNVPVTEKISKYLPSTWTAGPNADAITFHELLTHTSGWRDPDYWMDYGKLKSQYAAGVKLADKIRYYQNGNYSLMRVLIPRLNGSNPSGTDAQLNTAYALAYEKYCNDHIFTRVGIRRLSSVPDEVNPPLNYPFPHNGAQGTSFGDFTENNAQAGWNISVLELAMVLRHLRYSNDILPSEAVENMLDQLYGFDAEGTTPGFKIHYVMKGGYFPGPPYNPGEFNGRLFFFDNGISMVVYVNSNLDYGGGLDQLVIDAFDAAR